VPRFFVPREEIIDNTVLISGQDRDHIVKTLRMRAGESIELCDMEGFVYDGVIEQIDQNGVRVQCNSQKPCDSEPDVYVTMYVAVPKGDKSELIVQKCVELGASKIVFFSSSRCVSRPDDKAAAKKIDRLNKIAQEAAKQSERGVLPCVEGIISYSQMLKSSSSCDLSLFFYERGGLPIKVLLTEAVVSSVALITGPEGGFSDDEVADAMKAGCRIASLGKRILRCETAPFCALTAVMYHTDNF